MTAPLFLASTEALASTGVGSVVVLDGAEGRHAADVRRLRVGEAIDLSDGRGLLLHGEVADVGRGTVSVSVRAVEHIPAHEPRFVVVQALARGGRDEDAVEAMTEVGVDEVVGWAAARSVAKWTGKTEARWLATARAGAKQSRSPWVPAVTGPVTTEDVAVRLRRAVLGVVLHEEAEEPLASVDVPAEGEVVVVVGPEGGVAPGELTQFAAAGARVCRLGDRVLRSSTAGVAALSVLSAATRWR